MKYFSILLLFLFKYACITQNQTEFPNNKISTKEKSVILNSSSDKYSAGDVIFQSYLDGAGNMWFATSKEGIYKYDGQTFTNYNISTGLCGNNVSSIIEDRDGFFWFGTENGLCKFDGQNYTTISLPEYPKKSEWLDGYYPLMNPKAVSTLLHDQQGNFWVGTNCAGVYKYDGNQYKSYLQESGNLMPDSMHHNAISSIVKDKQGHIWIGSFSHGGISQYTGNHFIHHSLKDGIGDGMISSIYIDKKDKMWVGTRNGGVYFYNGQSFQPFQDVSNDEEIPMAKFFEDSQERLWMSSYARKGVYQYNGQTFAPFNITHSDKLIDVMCISEDKDGNIWFGGRYGLLWRYDGKELKDFTYEKRNQ